MYGNPGQSRILDSMPVANPGGGSTGSGPSYKKQNFPGFRIPLLEVKRDLQNDK